MAFAIDAWWDIRTQQEEAHAYIEAMRTELIENREILLEGLDAIRGWVLESEDFLNTVVAPGASPSYEDVRKMVWETGPSRTTPLLRAAVDDLTSSGGFKIIDSRELRQALSNYLRALDGDAVEQDRVRDAFSRFVLPYHLNHGSFTEFDWEQYAELNDSPAEFQLDVEEFVENRAYANLLISRILGYSNLRDTHRNIIEEIDKTLKIIEEL